VDSGADRGDGREDGGARGRAAGPYAAAAWTYREAGWEGVLPVAGKDRNLPREYTGRAGGWPDDDQVAAWVASRGADNVALRVPRDVLGIDVDAYDGRLGLATTEWYAEQVGEPLPPTWYSTSRADGSRILLYRVPQDVEWVSDLGRDSDVQVVRHGHRYAVCWPSRHPRTGAEYRWYRPDGTPAEGPPSPGELAALPAGWVRALSKSGRPPGGPGSGAPGGGYPGGRPPGGWDPQDRPALDQDGRAVDVRRVLLEGLPPGEQQNGLFSYACSMRARGFHRDEMVALGMIAIQRMANQDPADPWTPEHVARLVDRVRREYPPGGYGGMPAELREFAARVAAGGGATNGQVQGTGAGVEGVGEAEGSVAGGARVGWEPARDPAATDLGNSARVVRVLGDRLRYAADLGRWLVWDGRRWAPDALERALHLCGEVVDDVRRSALAADDPADSRRWAAWAHESESLGKRTAMLRGAQAAPELAILSSELDADPYLLTVRNGAVDLRTGRLREARRSDLSSRMAAVDYQEGAPCPRWEAHVRFLCAGNEALAAYLRRVAGYTLTGDVGSRAFFFLEGTGTNGKNAFVEPLVQVLGDYAMTASTALITGGDEQHPTVLADLLGRRMVFVDETRQNRALNVERIKALTGSRSIKARHMRQDFFEFRARFKLWIAGNGRPTVKDPSDGVWTRMHRVQCLGKVSAGELIRNYGELLYAEEASGILSWALAGLADWRGLGEDLGQPQSVRDDVQAYRDDEDYEAQFVAETLEVTGSAADVLTSDQVYQAYRTWAEGAGLARADVKNRMHLGRAMSRLGIQGGRPYVEGRQVRALIGVRWQPGRAPWGA
jgi:P4 family phage/plasmid primase-like protien